MTLQTLALVIALGLLGPVLAIPRAVPVPVVVGELAAGIAFGETGLRVLHPGDPSFTFLAQLGFALIMFVAGSHVPVRDARLRSALGLGALRAVAVGLVAAVLGVAIARAFGTGHAAMYAVVMASSSAALVLPIVDAAGEPSGAVLQMLPQVAIADAACIVALPLAIDTKHVGRAALGALAVIGAAVVLFGVLLWLERSGYRRRAHHVSEQRKFALELRFSLLILAGLAALATRTHVSIMLAGFTFGLAVSAVGEPRRLARQLFAVTEGFLGPLFFVWIGATIDLRQLGSHRSYIVIGMALGAGALVAHAAMRLSGQPVSLGALAAAQLGVPIAAVTVGNQLHLLHHGEASALVLGAVITIVAAAVSAAVGLPRAPAPTPAA